MLRWRSYSHHLQLCMYFCRINSKSSPSNFKLDFSCPLHCSCGQVSHWVLTASGSQCAALFRAWEGCPKSTFLLLAEHLLPFPQQHVSKQTNVTRVAETPFLLLLPCLARGSWVQESSWTLNKTPTSLHPGCSQNWLAFFFFFWALRCPRVQRAQGWREASLHRSSERLWNLSPA